MSRHHSRHSMTQCRALLVEYCANTVQMMRYRGKLQRSSYPLISVDPADEGAALEEKWRRWIDMERWKR